MTPKPLSPAAEAFREKLWTVWMQGMYEEGIRLRDQYRHVFEGAADMAARLFDAHHAEEVAGLKSQCSALEEERRLLVDKLNASQEESAGRLKVLQEKAAESASEWRRAEQAEARVEALQARLAAYGEICSACNAPQYVTPDGEHHCYTSAQWYGMVEVLQKKNERLQEELDLAGDPYTCSC